jgi:hypothetical protein
MERSYYQARAAHLMAVDGPGKVRRVLAFHRRAPMPGISEHYVPALEGVLAEREAA